MVQLQRLTGMRSGELCKLRTCDVDRTGSVWIYRPPSHKTAYKGHQRIIRIGPKGQNILSRWLRADKPDAYVFSPRIAQRERLKRIRRHEKAGSRAHGTWARKSIGSAYNPRSY